MELTKRQLEQETAKLEEVRRDYCRVIRGR